MNAKYKGEIIRYAVLALASLLLAVDYRTFVSWGALYPGGAAVLSMLVQRLSQLAVDFFGIKFTVPFGPINLVLNAIPVYIGFRYDLEKKED